MYIEQTFGLCIPRLELCIADRPRGREAVGVLDRLEVAHAKAEHRGAEKLRVTTHIVELAGAKRLGLRVVPGVVRAIALLDEDRFRVPVLRLARQALAALQYQNASAARRKRDRGAAAADSGADDDDVVVGSRSVVRHGLPAPQLSHDALGRKRPLDRLAVRFPPLRSEEGAGRRRTDVSTTTETI